VAEAIDLNPPSRLSKGRGCVYKKSLLTFFDYLFFTDLYPAAGLCYQKVLVVGYYFSCCPFLIFNEPLAKCCLA